MYSTTRLYNHLVMDMQPTDPLSTTFAALADATRRSILDRALRAKMTDKGRSRRRAEERKPLAREVRRRLTQMYTLASNMC